MTVTLTPEQERIVSEQVKAGKYSSPAEFLDKAIHLIAELGDEIQEDDSFIEDAKAQIAEGLADVAAGRVDSEDDFRARIAEERQLRKLNRS